MFGVFISSLIKVYTFRFNSECSLLKLLCTIVCLCLVTLFKLIRFDFFGIDITSHLLSLLPFLFSLFAGSTKRLKALRSHDRALLPNLTTSTNLTTPTTIAFPLSPFNYQFFPAKLSEYHANSCHQAPLEEFFPCISRNSLTLLFL